MKKQLPLAFLRSPILSALSRASAFSKINFQFCRLSDSNQRLFHQKSSALTSEPPVQLEFHRICHEVFLSNRTFYFSIEKQINLPEILEMKYH